MKTKTADSRLRQNSRCCVAQLVEEQPHVLVVAVDQVEVDVLE